MPTPDPRRQALESASTAVASRPTAAPQGRNQDLFRGGARRVLARLLEGDPLLLRPRVAARLRARCLLLDAERVLLSALATCAREGAARRQRPGFERWLDEVVERAVDERLQRCEEPSAAFVELALPLGFEPGHLARASARFNALDGAARRAFFELVLVGRDLDDGTVHRGRDAVALARDARRALHVFLEADGPDLVDGQGGTHAP